jgi:hypothetical protein
MLTEIANPCPFVTIGPDLVPHLSNKVPWTPKLPASGNGSLVLLKQQEHLPVSICPGSDVSMVPSPTAPDVTNGKREAKITFAAANRMLGEENEPLP